MKLLTPIGAALRRARRTPGAVLSVAVALAAAVGLGGPVLSLVRTGLGRSVPYADPLLRESGEWGIRWTSARETLVEAQDRSLETLLQVALVLTLLLLAIALIDVIVLLVARAAARRREAALRVALGATPRRLVGELLAEGAVPVLIGGALALLLAPATAGLLGASWPHEAAPWGARPFQVRVLAAVAALFALAALLARLAPAGVAGRRDLRGFLGTGGRATAGPGEGTVRSVVAVVQIAACLVLLTGAGLLLRSHLAGPAEATRPGADPRDTLVVPLRLPAASFPHAPERAALFGEVLTRVGGVPGVVDTSLASGGALVGVGPTDLVHGLTGIPERPGIARPARYHVVGPDHFRTLERPPVMGREFTRADSLGAPRTVLVNEEFAYRILLTRDPVGKQIQLGRAGLDDPFYTVVGLVRDAAVEGIGAGTAPFPAVYLSALQHPPRVATLTVRTAGDSAGYAPAVERAVRAAGAEMEPPGATTLDEHLAQLRAPVRWFARLFTVLAVAALLLAALGLHGVMSYHVSRRTREIGIRMALGARVAQVVRLVLGQSARLAALGTVLGLVGAVSLARLLQLLLPGVRPLDPLLLGVLSATLVGLALAASWWPARRAASVDPQLSLRAE